MAVARVHPSPQARDGPGGRREATRSPPHVTGRRELVTSADGQWRHRAGGNPPPAGSGPPRALDGRVVGIGIGSIICGYCGKTVV
jgi:hypothetical protein